MDLHLSHVTNRNSYVDVNPQVHTKQLKDSFKKIILIL